MKRTLLLMRHAKSDWNDANLSDFDRPLNNRGRRSAPLMAQWLAEHDLVPDIVLSSTARRARETAEIVIQTLQYSGPTQWSERLYHASPATLTEAIEQGDNNCRRLLLVAHNPGMESLVSSLGETFAAMPTAAIAWFEFESETWKLTPKPSNFRLVQIACPKEL
jgi:phosphohistidine phosphatase